MTKYFTKEDIKNIVNQQALAMFERVLNYDTSITADKNVIIETELLESELLYYLKGISCFAKEIIAEFNIISRSE